MHVERGVQWIVLDSSKDCIIFIVFGFIGHMSRSCVVCGQGSLAASKILVAFAHMPQLGDLLLSRQLALHRSRLNLRCIGVHSVNHA